MRIARTYRRGCTQRAIDITVELRGTDIAGIAVHIATQVLEAAAASEHLVSATVPMLVAGAGFEFNDRGEHELKGVQVSTSNARG
jgi:hypothetical protein